MVWRLYMDYVGWRSLLLLLHGVETIHVLCWLEIIVVATAWCRDYTWTMLAEDHCCCYCMVWRLYMDYVGWRSLLLLLHGVETIHGLCWLKIIVVDTAWCGDYTRTMLAGDNCCCYCMVWRLYMDYVGWRSLLLLLHGVETIHGLCWLEIIVVATAWCGDYTWTMLAGDHCCCYCMV